MNPLGSILNFRDVAETVNKNMGKRFVRMQWSHDFPELELADRRKNRWIKPGLVYRSARPDESTLEDRRMLRDKYEIKMIMDLRTSTEREQQEHKRKQRVAQLSQARLMSEVDSRVPPLQIPGIAYQLINFNGFAYSRHLISQLTWPQFFNLLYLLLARRRLEAISILGQNVMTPRGLTGLALDSLDVCRSQVYAVFSSLLSTTSYPWLIHCTQGKDRTGLVVILLLMLLDTPTPDIEHDYLLSGHELLPEREDKIKEVHSIGLPDEFADCDPMLVRTVVHYINHNYDSIDNYLLSSGFMHEMQQQLKAIFCAEEHPFTTIDSK